MKKLMACLCLTAGFALTTFAQEREITRETYPYHTISKGVQQLQFKNTTYVPAKITTGDLATVSGKGVNKFSTRRSNDFTAVQMTGTPSWVISKGVARMQYERNKSK